MRAARLRLALVAWLGSMLAASAGESQLALEWMVPAAAHAPGLSGTYWRSDVSLHNPHRFELPVVLQALESGQANWSVPTLELVLAPFETVNLWDALGPELFAIDGTAALLAYAAPTLACDPLESCEFLVTSRTYTTDPRGGDGEYGQGIPGRPVTSGVDWWTYGYAAGVLNDGQAFRCNVGAGSWSADWVTLQVDVQDLTGGIVATEVLDLPPFGHLQQRLATPVAGGSLVFYLVSGPDDALVFPYASVVSQASGDPSFVTVEPSPVGVSVDKAAAHRVGRRPLPDSSGAVTGGADRSRP